MEQPPASNEQELEDRLRAASDGIQLVVQQLRVLEEQKRGIEPRDPRFAEFTVLVRSTAAALLKLATTEEAFAHDLRRAPADMSAATIEQVTPRHDLRQILEEWRDVERQLAEVQPGSREARALVERFEQLRAEYARASDPKRQAQTPEARE